MKDYPTKRHRKFYAYHFAFKVNKRAPALSFICPFLCISPRTASARPYYM